MHQRSDWITILMLSVTLPKERDDREVILPGGSIGDISQWVEDVPNLEMDRTYLIFLGEHDGRLQIIGGDQGAIPIRSADYPAGEPLNQAITSVGDCRAKN